jgi:hypothetical protein
MKWQNNQQFDSGHSVVEVEVFQKRVVHTNKRKRPCRSLEQEEQQLQLE